MIRTPSDPGIPYVHEIRSVAPSDTGMKMVKTVMIMMVAMINMMKMVLVCWSLSYMFRNVHLRGQKCSWQVKKDVLALDVGTLCQIAGFALIYAFRIVLRWVV